MVPEAITLVENSATTTNTTTNATYFFMQFLLWVS
jgi:hypothetical protein